MSNRVRRTPAELREALHEQVSMLQLAVENFDGGAIVAGKQIAAVLRTLLYAPNTNRKGNRTSPLLHQLNLVRHRFLNTATSIRAGHLSVIGNQRPKGLIPACGLVNLVFWPGGAAFYAPLDNREPARFPNAPYSDWWTSPVLRDTGGNLASRLDLVSHVASTDGGAHVDAELDKHFVGWKSGVSLGWNVSKNGMPATPIKNIELHCMRQIAHDVLRTLSGVAPWAFDKAYAYPQRPSHPEGSSWFDDGVVLVGGATFGLEGTSVVLSSDA